jgi:hypothetical protein
MSETNLRTDAPQLTSESKRNSRWSNSRQPLFIAVIACVVLLAATGWYAYKYLFQPEDQAKAAASVPYLFDEELGDRLLANHLLQGNDNGAGILFRVPLNGFVYTNSPLDQPDPRLAPKSLNDAIVDTGSDVVFVQRTVALDSTVINQTVLAAEAVPNSETADFNRDDYFRKLVASVVFSEGEDTDVKLETSQASQFSNTSVSENASIYTVTASYTGSENLPVDHVVGELIEIKGQNGTYYLLLAAIDKTWDSSPKTWQAIKDSIKVDQ